MRRIFRMQLCIRKTSTVDLQNRVRCFWMVCRDCSSWGREICDIVATVNKSLSNEVFLSKCCRNRLCGTCLALRDLTDPRRPDHNAFTLFINEVVRDLIGVPRRVISTSSLDYFFPGSHQLDHMHRNPVFSFQKRPKICVPARSVGFPHSIDSTFHQELEHLLIFPIGQTVLYVPVALKQSSKLSQFPASPDIDGSRIFQLKSWPFVELRI